MGRMRTMALKSAPESHKTPPRTFVESVPSPTVCLLLLFLPQKSRRGLPASHLRRDHHNPWCTGVSSCTVQHICDVSHFCTHTGAETPVRATDFLLHLRIPRTHAAHTRRTHIPTPAHNILNLVRRGWWGCVRERPPDIEKLFYSGCTYSDFSFSFYYFNFYFMLLALRYAKSQKEQTGRRRVGDGARGFHKGARRIVMFTSETLMRPTLGPLCASSPWGRKDPQKGSPGPPKRVPRTPQKGPPKGSPRKP